MHCQLISLILIQYSLDIAQRFPNDRWSISIDLFRRWFIRQYDRFSLIQPKYFHILRVARLLLTLLLQNRSCFTYFALTN